MKKVVQDLTSGGLLGVWGKWVKHTKYIYNIQDFNPEQVLAVGYTKSKFITDAMMWFDKFSCKRSDLVITVGRDLVETVENRFKGKKVPKTVMINNWIDENEIYPLDESNERVVAFKKKYGLDRANIILNGNQTLCSLTRLQPGNRQVSDDLLLSACTGLLRLCAASDGAINRIKIIYVLAPRCQCLS